MVAFIPQPHGSLEHDNQAFFKSPAGRGAWCLGRAKLFPVQSFSFPHMLFSYHKVQGGISFVTIFASIGRLME